MPSNLKLRGSIYYARRAVPRGHWDRLGKRELVRTLGTGDLKAARRLLPVALAALDAEIDRLIGSADARPGEPAWLLDVARQARALALRGGLDPRFTEPDELPSPAESGLDAAVDAYEEAGGSDQVAALAYRVFRGQHGLLLSEAIKRHLAELEVAGVVRSWVKAKERELGALMEFLGDVEVRDITRQLAGAYVAAKVNLSGTSANTRRNRVAVLVSFGESLVTAGELEVNPFGRLRKMVRESGRGDAERTKRPYTPEEMLKVFTELLKRCPEGDPMVAAAALCSYTGMRIEEVCTLRVADCTDDVLRVTKAKNQNSIRAVPVHPAISALVKRLRANSSDGFMIPGLTRAGADKRRSHALGNRYRRYVERMGLPKTLDAHGLRRSFIQRAEDAGVPVSTVKLLVGHARGDLTYGLYSTGPEWLRLVDAMGKVAYGPEVDALVRSLK